ALEGRQRVAFGLFQHRPGGGCLADARRAVDDDVLGVGPAQGGPERLEPFFLADDVVERGRARLLGQRLRQGDLLEAVEFFHLFARLAVDGGAACVLGPQQVEEIETDDDGKKEVDQPKDAHDVHHRRVSLPRPRPRSVYPRGGSANQKRAGNTGFRLHRTVLELPCHPLTALNATAGGPSGGFFLLFRLALHPHKGGRLAFQYTRLVDDALDDIVPGRDLVHHVQEDAFHDGPQAASAGLALEGLAGDGPQRPLGELQLHAVHLEKLLELLYQGIAGLDQDAHQGVFVQGIRRHHDGQAPDELRDHPVLEQVFGHDLAQQVPAGFLLPGLDVRAEADALLADAPLDDLLKAVKGAAADEEDVGRVDLDELLVRVLAPALGRDAGHRALQDLKQRLLDAFARHVPGNGRVLGLAGDLVHLV